MQQKDGLHRGPSERLETYWNHIPLLAFSSPGETIPGEIQLLSWFGGFSCTAETAVTKMPSSPHCLLCSKDSKLPRSTGMVFPLDTFVLGVVSRGQERPVSLGMELPHTSPPHTGCFGAGKGHE